MTDELDYMDRAMQSFALAFDCLEQIGADSMHMAMEIDGESVVLIIAKGERAGDLDKLNSKWDEDDG